MEARDHVRAEEQRNAIRRAAPVARWHHAAHADDAVAELEQDGLVWRTAYAEKQLRVEYELTDAAYGLSPAFMELLSWSKLHGTGRGKRLDGALCRHN